MLGPDCAEMRYGSQKTKFVTACNFQNYLDSFFLVFLFYAIKIIICIQFQYFVLILFFILFSEMRIALLKGHVNMVRYIVSQSKIEFDWNDKNSNTLTNSAKLLAAENGHLEVLQYLDSQGVDLGKARENGNSVLMFAAQKGYLDIIQYMDETKRNVMITNKFGYIVPTQAAFNGHLHVPFFHF